MSGTNPRRPVVPPTDVALAYDGVAFMLLSPGAPWDELPVSLQDRDDEGPKHEPHDPFVIGQGLYKSARAARRAARKEAVAGGRTRRLLVRLRLCDARAVDASVRLDAMALKRGEVSQLDELADLYEREVDLVTVSGPEGKVILVFKEAIGSRLLIERETIVRFAPPHDQLRARRVLVDAALAFGFAEIAPVVHLPVPSWVVGSATFTALLARPAWKTLGRTVDRILELIEDTVERLEPGESPDRETERPRQKRIGSE